MNPRKRKQTVVTVFDGRVHHVALCRGFLDGLPAFAWGEAPSVLLTKSQLRDAGLRPNGQDPLALLVFRHHKPFRHETVAEPFSVELAAEVRPLRPGQLDAANQARRTCGGCDQVKPYVVPTSTRRCWDCFDADTAGVAA
ncbi:hypothetical protein L3Q67_07755 [Saccharothrix sp. AJ9571]|nr:hypothetical protein L3Q67_07755 [Saccharothrix sp. AJ9571]